jgi:aminoglycoside 6-adenylyltransferase
MENTSLFYEHFLARFTSWAEAQEDIRAVVMVGSRARSDQPADDWSDLDLMIYARNHEAYLGDTRWLQRLGQPWVSFVSTTSGEEREILASFKGGYNVDFVLVAASDLQQMADQGIIPHGNLRGARVVVDKDGLAAKTIPAEFHPPISHDPGLEEFTWIVNAFWDAAFYLAKQIRRGDLWMVKARDADLKRCLLQMMEWHARACHPEIRDTWHMGRFLENWADARALQALPETFGRYDAGDSARALKASMDLFRWLAVETAAAINISYPVDVEREATLLVSRLLT